MKFDENTALARLREAAEHQGVRVVVREPKPASGMFIARPGRGSGLHDEPSDTPHPEPSRTS